MKSMLYFRMIILVLSLVFLISFASAACDYSGTWVTNWGDMTITQSGQYGEIISGSYVHDSGKITGRLSGSTVTGKWSEAPTYSGPRDAGGFVFKFNDCNSFSGTYGYDQATSGSTWSGTRKSGPTSSTTSASSGSTTGTTQPTKKGCTGSGTSIYVDDRTMNPGQEVVIPIMMCNANDIANMDLSVGYDSSALQFKDAVKGSLNSNVMFESNNVGNKVKIAFASKSGFSGSGSIAVLTFRVIGQNGATSPITVTVDAASTSGGKSVAIPVNNGKVSIGNTNPNDPGGRGKVTSLDALIALQISVGKRPTDSNYDVTKDGVVNSNDAREILKLAVQ